MTALGERLRYLTHEATTDGAWHRLRLTLSGDGIQADVLLASPDGVAAFSSEVTVTATGAAPVCLRSVSSWAAPLGVRDAGSWEFHSAASDWLAESRWSARPFRPDLFPAIAAHLTGVRPRGAATLVSRGTWSSGEHAPVAAAASDSDGAAWLGAIPLVRRTEPNPWRIPPGLQVLAGAANVHTPDYGIIGPQPGQVLDSLCRELTAQRGRWDQIILPR